MARILAALCVCAALAPLDAFAPCAIGKGWESYRRTLRRQSDASALRCSAEQRPKRVAVIGGGPAGLATALALQRLPTGVESVTVFEQKESLRPGVGGGIQINGGAAVLCKLGLEDEIRAAGNPLERVVSRNVDGTELLNIQVPDLIRGANGKPPPILQLVDMAAVVSAAADDEMSEMSSKVVN
jgi:salicylate hydroxylase